MLQVKGDGAWEKEIENKSMYAIGTVRKMSGDSTFAMDNGHWQLTNLENQLGRTVALRGKAVSLNDEWWFVYRGTALYVEKMKDLPHWRDAENHWRPMTIRGILAKEKLPTIDQISLKEDRDLKEYYIVKNASWEPLDQLLAPDCVHSSEK